MKNSNKRPSYTENGYKQGKGGEDPMTNHFDFTEGERIYVKAGSTIYKGNVTEVENQGIWITSDHETEEFLSFDDLKDWEWAVE
ncbi:hypothetical protein ACM6N5_09355 [Rossellomorea marisflavi]|uniref:hypothetical protein n=1 Tax=Rossellomorea marisflavi TaxID=189381 RepID=UPI003AEDFA55